MTEAADPVRHRTVFVSALLVCVVATLAVALSVWQSRSDAIAQAVRSDRSTAAFLAGQIEHAIREVDGVVRDYRELAEIFAVTSGDDFGGQFSAQALRDWMAAKIQAMPHTVCMAIADASGRIVSSSRPVPGAAPGVADTHYFDALRGAGRDALQVSLPTRMGISGESVMVLARRIEEADGGFRGIVMVSVATAWFDRLYLMAGFLPDQTFTLSLRNGTVLLRYPADAHSAGRRFPAGSPWYGQVAAGGGSYRSPSSPFDGVTRWVSVQPLPSLPLVLAVTSPEAGVLAAWRSRSAYAAFGAVALLTCQLALLIVLARQLRQLAVSRRDLAAHSQSLALSNARLLDTNAQFAATLRSMSQGLCMFDAAGRLRVCNDEFRRIWGLPAELGPGWSRDAVLAERMRKTKRHIETSFPPGDDPFATDTDRTSTVLVELDSGRVIAVTEGPTGDGGRLETHDDVTDRHRHEERIAFLARYDSLTGLPNRATFLDRLEAARLGLRSDGTPFAVLMIDLDRFKDINDSVGHMVGDAVLRQTAIRLAQAARGDDMLARLGGDEFAVIRSLRRDAGAGPDRRSARDEAAELAERIAELLALPHRVDGDTHVVRASIGIAFAPDDGDDPVDLVKKADLALYRAKAAGTGGFVCYDPAMTAEVEARRRLEAELRRSLADGDFRVHYQPIVEVATGRVCSVEALVRWQHPERGLLTPQEFVPLAEQTGLITSLGEWVLRTACAEAARWPGRMKVAVNVSAVQFRRPGLLESIEQALREAGLPPDRLEVEITETVLLENEERNVSVLHRLKSLGVAVALDDFGTGYASLAYLTMFPFGKLKIDRRFTRDVLTRPDCAAIVCSATALGLSLGMTVVAEGVETPGQLEIVRITGVTQAQGWLFGAPMPADAIAGRIAAEVTDRPRRLLADAS
ncbi:EAL domain-containing protein [Rhodoplanes sp. TEM]|uniref:EAL domain-containing protein n=1 Tax=Rhodoplanes tepidamans TaxID=200616 RepID=A0ABT5JDR4_RHOTP|nr:MULTISPECIES: EAL domain-containing protein [Rhodoplanes]MDC7787491.1 EAL domain-containing protein [Rhodoplanes tepidamans]MDC7983918.1 EAL domain-containing protein [Rhodoplanes sp. TEM]MDQ0354357.1 diguanylate cyclase (GGDEF)-like protein [Rhodoplanes tepidamans]